MRCWVRRLRRLSSEDRRKQEFQNRIEKLRTPSKIRVYSKPEIAEFMQAEGLEITHVQYYEQQQAVEEWLETTGAPAENQQHARELMRQCLEDDLGGWKVRGEAGRLMMTHTTAILVAVNPGADTKRLR